MNGPLGGWVARRSVREQRLLRFGALALGLWLLVTFGVRPFISDLHDLRERVSRERSLLTRETELLAAASGFARRYAAIERVTLGQAPRLFAGSDALAASGALASYVSGRAAAHRVMVQQTEVQAASAVVAGVLALRVDLRGVSDLEGLAGFLFALEEGPKLVGVEQLVLSRVVAGPGQGPEQALSFIGTFAGYAFADSAAERGAEP